MIKYFDNILSPYLQDDLITMLNPRPPHGGYPLFFTPNLTGDFKNKNEFGFGSDFFSDGKLINHFGNRLLTPLYSFLNSQDIVLKEIIRGRLSLQLPRYGTTEPLPSSPHRDLDIPHYVAIYYVTDSDGDTIFYNDDMIEIKRVTPKKGRIVFFDGNILHSGSSCTKNIRVFLNYNFTINNEIRSRK